MFSKKVPEDDYVYEEHGPVVSYFSSLWTHFLKIMSVNLMFVICNIPMLIFAAFFAFYFLPKINDVFDLNNFTAFMTSLGLSGNESINDVGTDAVYQVYYLIILFCAMFLTGSGLLCIGPFQAGFSMIYRNMYRQDGVFLFSDFKEGVKKNWKQSLIASIISIVVTSLILMAIAFYHVNFGNVGTAITTFFVILFAVFVVIQNVVYSLIVSVDLPLTKIYRNAFLFFLLKPGPCLGLILAEFVALLAIPYLLLFTTVYFAYAIAVFYYLILIFAVTQYMMAYFAGEMIKTYIIPKNAENNTENNIEENENGEANATDDSVSDI